MTEQKTTIWKVDQSHSEVQFKVKHLTISNVSGTFKQFSGRMQSDAADFANAKISFEIEAGSLDTNNKDRDEHLRGPQFLNVEKFPKILFDGTLQKKNDAYALTGDLTICGITNQVALEADYTGTGTGRFGDTRAGFELTGKLLRKDYGLTFNVLTEAGGLVIGEEIKLHFDIQLIRE